MAKHKAKSIYVKHGQVKYSPFLHFDELPINIVYKFRSKEQKKVDDEIKKAQKEKRKKIITTLGFIANIVVLAVVLIVQLSTEDIKTVIAPTIDWKFMGIVIAVVAGIILIDSSKIFVLIRSSTKKTRPFLAYKTSALGRYYDSITPMSTGGQPFQMLYMSKRGVRGDIATGIPLMKYIIWQITYVFMCTFILIYNGVKFGSTTDVVTTTVAWVSILINLAIFLTIVLLSVSKRVGPKIVIGVLKLLSKMHLVKNYQKTFRKVMRFVVNYQKTFKMLLTSPLVLIIEFVLAIGDIILFNSIPFFVMRSFIPASLIPANVTFFKTFIQSVICGLTLGFIPTPGSSGGAEAIFILIFGGLFKSANVGTFWPLLIWRMATYYIFLLQGLLVLVYDFAIGNRKAEKLKQQQLQTAAATPDGVVADLPKPSFRKTLEENRKTIEVVQSQEQDKIAPNSFTG
ncbi:MAG: flippase-like domain-containing protein, partial [Clostridia bacterium]|nr:flippase-like domain-containing protein [Clostridia bacterium]